MCNYINIAAGPKVLPAYLQATCLLTGLNGPKSREEMETEFHKEVCSYAPL